MKIIVTGGAGFIGSEVVRTGISRGHRIVNIDKLTYAACLENLADVEDHQNYAFRQIDICDPGAVARVFEETQPDAVMHLAAESHVDRSIDGPSDFVQTNVIGTFNMLEASRGYFGASESSDAFRFLHVSTDEVYGSLGPSGRFTETTAYDPRSPYSASKASSDHLVRAWHETYGLPTIISNCSNNYGPYQFPEKLIPVVILNAIAGKPIPVYGDGSNVRDWLFVEDHAQALFLVLEKGQPGQNYNIGGENEYSNLELVTSICKLLDEMRPRADGSYGDLIEFVTDRPGHDMRYAIDPTFISEQLGWTPTTDVQSGLAKTIRWYLDNEAWWRNLQSRPGFGQRLGRKK